MPLEDYEFPIVGKLNDDGLTVPLILGDKTELSLNHNEAVLLLQHLQFCGCRGCDGVVQTKDGDLFVCSNGRSMVELSFNDVEVRIPKPYLVMRIIQLTNAIREANSPFAIAS